jgi:flagellar protein FliS
MSSLINKQAALAQYGQMKNDQANVANSHQMIAMLFDAAIESINVMLGAINKQRVDIKGKASSKAIRIINGMRDLLDLSKGMEVAQNLYELYSFMAQDLFRASYENDVDAIKTVRHMLKEVRESWGKMPQGEGQVVADGPTSATAAMAPSVPVSEPVEAKAESNLRKPALGLRQSAFYS